jgi:hypothetical protein
LAREGIMARSNMVFLLPGFLSQIENVSIILSQTANVGHSNGSCSRS